MLRLRTQFAPGAAKYAAGAAERRTVCPAGKIAIDAALQMAIKPSKMKILVFMMIPAEMQLKNVKYI